MAESSETLRLATWNVKRSLATKITFVYNALREYQIDLACLQETGLTDELSNRIGEYNFKYSGKLRADMRKFQGVGIAFKEKLENNLKIVSLPPEIAERIMYCQYQTTVGLVHIINVYSPTEKKESIENDTFYEDLEDILLKVPESERVFILGDFNAHVGADNEVWTSCIGQYRYGTVNNNGQRLLEFCSFHNLCITNTFFDDGVNKSVTFHSTTKNNWHQLDLIVTRVRDRDCMDKIETGIVLEHTDHCLVACDVTLSLVDERNALNKRKTDIGIEPTEDSNETYRLIKFMLCEQLLRKPKPDRDIKINWSRLKEHISRLYPFSNPEQFSAFKMFCKSYKNRLTNFEIAWMNYKKNTNNKNLKNFRDKKRLVEKLVSEFLTAKHINEIQKEDILKELHNHLQEVSKVPLYKKKKAALEISTVNWSQLEKLPSILYLDEVIKSPENHNELNDIPETKKQDIFRFLREKRSLLYSLLSACWKSGHVPLKMCYARIKFSSLNYNVHSVGHEPFSGINVVSFICNAIRCVISKQIRSVALSNKSLIKQLDNEDDLFISLKTLQEKFRKKKLPLFMAFVDLSNVCDQMNRRFLLNFLSRVGCPPTLVHLIAHFISEKDNESSLTAVLRNFFFNYTLNVQLDTKQTICIQSNISKTCPRYLYLNGLHYGKKLVIFGKTIKTLEQCLKTIKVIFKSVHLRIFTTDPSSEMRSLQILDSKAGSQQKNITIDSKKLPIQAMVKFGNELFASKVNSEIQYSICVAARSMASLSLLNTSGSKKGKIMQYNDYVLEELVNRCKFMTKNIAQEENLNNFHVKSLRRILGLKVKAADSSDVLHAAGLDSVHKKLKQKRLEEHSKMERRKTLDITRQIFFGEIIVSKKRK